MGERLGGVRGVYICFILSWEICFVGLFSGFFWKICGTPPGFPLGYGRIAVVLLFDGFGQCLECLWRKLCRLWRWCLGGGGCRNRRSAGWSFAGNCGLRSKHIFPLLTYMMMELRQKVSSCTKDFRLGWSLRSNCQKDLPFQLSLLF